jgi:hypothetical protein
MFGSKNAKEINNMIERVKPLLVKLTEKAESIKINHDKVGLGKMYNFFYNSLSKHASADAISREIRENEAYLKSTTEKRKRLLEDEIAQQQQVSIEKKRIYDLSAKRLKDKFGHEISRKKFGANAGIPKMSGEWKDKQKALGLSDEQIMAKYMNIFGRAYKGK